MHPEIKISQRKFENLKSYFVRGARERDRQTCMSHHHVELQIVFKDCMKFRKRVTHESREANQAVTEVYTSVGNIIEQALCPKRKDQDYQDYEKGVQRLWSSQLGRKVLAITK